MKIFLITIITLLSIEVGAQSHLMGIKAGINWANANSNIVKNYPVFLVNSGIAYEYVLPSRFFIGSGINYDKRGFYDLIEIRNFAGERWGTVRSNYRFDYLSLPLKAGYYFGNTFFGFGSIGVNPAILLNARATFWDPFRNEFQHKYLADITSNFDIGGTVEFGGGYKLNSQFMLFSSILYHHSFGRFSNLFYDYRHTSRIFTIGFKYSILGNMF